MNQYQKEQLEAVKMVRQYLDAMTQSEKQRLKEMLTRYLEFRSRVTSFLESLFSTICTEKCYASKLSACCSKDGIVAFFGDVVVNALISSPHDLDNLEAAIARPEQDTKCIFLSEKGCLWHSKPIVCEMFLCDEAEHKVFGNNMEARKKWEELKTERKQFTWPDKIVLFEELESVFMEKGATSPLMYIHYSPGLLRIKNNRER
jgi:hypothetical protein